MRAPIFIFCMFLTASFAKAGEALSCKVSGVVSGSMQLNLNIVENEKTEQFGDYELTLETYGEGEVANPKIYVSKSGVVLVEQTLESVSLDVSKDLLNLVMDNGSLAIRCSTY